MLFTQNVPTENQLIASSYRAYAVVVSLLHFQQGFVYLLQKHLIFILFDLLRTQVAW